jgi:DNA-binding transcriptional MerR regulator
MHSSDLIDDGEPKVTGGEMVEQRPHPEPLVSIGKIAKQYQVSLRTLRFYESSDLLHPLRKGRTRLYGAKDCHRLEMILRGKQLGFSIAEIQRLLQLPKDETADLDSRLSSAEIVTKLKSLEQRRADLDRAIHDLREKQKTIGHPKASSK